MAQVVNDPDGFKYSCMLFREMFDYSEYIHKHGCAFNGQFTCCPGVNITMLETFARDNCNTTDVCGYESSQVLLLEILSGVLMLFLIFVFSYFLNGWRVARIREREFKNRVGVGYNGYNTFHGV